MKRPGQEGNDPLVAIGDRQETPGLDAIVAFGAAVERGESCALVTVVAAEGSVPRGMGAAMMVRPDRSIVGTVGGGNLEELTIDHALEAMRDGRSRRYHYDFTHGAGRNIEKSCIGRCDFFVQPAAPRPRLYIFGAGHIGMALAPMARIAGFDVTVIDDRPDYRPLAGLPDGIHTLNGSFEECIEGLAFDEETYVVSVTHGHEADVQVLRKCLRRPARYLGMIGSKSKVAAVKRELGVDDESRARLETLHAPIGLKLGGRHPGEVAVSIVAELVADRYRDDVPDDRSST